MKKVKLAILLGMIPIFALADSAWIGNGSVMSAYKDNVSNSNFHDYPFGITKDMSKLHELTSNNVVFFQWFVNSNSCKRLKIRATTKDGKYSITPKANITVGPWYSRTKDRTFENITLPFVISKENVKYSKWFENQNWIVTAVEFVDGTESGNIYAQCTDEVEDIQTGIPIRFGHKVKLDGYTWNGNGSIISGYFKSQLYNNWNNPNVGSNSNWPYGVFKDVSRFSPKHDKQVVFFQWQRSDECSQLKIDIPDAPKSQKNVKLISKKWDESPFVVFEEYVELPYILKNKDKKIWTVVAVYSDESFDKQYKVEASCCTAPKYKEHLLKIKNPTCKERWDIYSRIKYEKILNSQRSIIKAKIDGTILAHDVVDFGLHMIDYYTSPIDKGVTEAYTAILRKEISTMFPNGDPDVINGFAGLMTDIIKSSVKGVVAPSDLIKNKATQIAGIFNNLYGAFMADSLIEQTNTSLLITYYLEDYYAWGGSHSKVAKANDVSENSSIEQIIDAVAKKHGYTNNWYGTEYHRNEIKENIKNIIKRISLHSKECLYGGCK